MPAHGKASAGFNEKDASIVVGVRGRIQDAPAHHIVPPWLKHQSLSNPVKLAQKMLAFFAHVRTHQPGPTLRYKPDRVAASVGVDAAEGLSGHFSCSF